jgi:hypothetical protein
MRQLTKQEIEFIKETGWTPTVEQCGEWDRTVFSKLFNKADFKERYINSEGYLIDEFSNKVAEYVLNNYNIDLTELYKKCTDCADGISLEYMAAYLFYTFFTKEELSQLTDETATKWLKDFQYYFGYRKWDGGNLQYVNDAIEVYNGDRVFYLDGDEVWNIEADSEWLKGNKDKILKIS